LSYNYKLQDSGGFSTNLHTKYNSSLYKIFYRVKVWRTVASKPGGRSRQGLVDDRVKAWWTIASKPGGRSRQGLVDDRVKVWRMIASRL